VAEKSVVATRMLNVSRVGILRELEARVWAERIAVVWESRKEGARARGWSLRTPYLSKMPGGPFEEWFKASLLKVYVFVHRRIKERAGMFL
jgi:hypothetical protein